jgi:hypothetical protein
MLDRIRIPIIENELVGLRKSSIDALLNKWLGYVIVADSSFRRHVVAKNFALNLGHISQLNQRTTSFPPWVSLQKLMPRVTDLRIFRVKISNSEAASDSWIDQEVESSFIRVSLEGDMRGINASRFPHLAPELKTHTRRAPTLEDLDFRIPRDSAGRPLSRNAYGIWRR